MTPQAYATATAYLAKFYGVSSYEREGIRHPVVVYLPEPEQVSDVDSLMGDLHEQAPAHFPIYDYGYLHTLQNSRRTLFDGVTFTLQHIEQYPLRVHGTYGRYFDMLATCTALEHELFDAVDERLIRLPLRSQLHRTLNISQAVWHGGGRSAALGGACLVVFNDGTRYQAILAQRSQQAATHPGFYHVLPAFIIQPAQLPAQPMEWLFSYHILREYAEELFGAEETSTPANVYRQPAVVQLQAMLADGRAALYATGVSLNLVTLRAELSALLLIHDPQWWAHATDPRSALRLNTTHETHDGSILTIPIANDADILAALPRHMYTLMPPQAYAAFWMAVDLARQKLQP